MNPRAILIDTSGKNSFIALARKEIILELHPLTEGRDLSKTLLPPLKALCENNPLSYIAVGIGPGTFTGTRMGVVIAKTLSFSLEIPLFSFSSSLLPNLETIASLSYEKFQNNWQENQIELVYFSKTP